MVDHRLSVVVDNLWIRPDGSIEPGRPRALAAAAYLPVWMLRVEGWAFVGRSRDALLVRFDPRCVNPAAFRGILDAIREMDGHLNFRSVEIQSYDAQSVVRWATGCTLAACCRVLEVYESAQALDDLRHVLLWDATDAVETQSLDLAATATQALLEPRMRAFFERWKAHRTLEPLIASLGEDAQYVSVYRMEDHDPRAHHLGGSLIFTAQNPQGARLNDILPTAQAQASRERIAGAVQSQQPLLRRHRSAAYDLLALSLPVVTPNDAFTVTMSQLESVAHPALQPFSAPARGLERTEPARGGPASGLLAGRSG